MKKSHKQARQKTLGPRIISVEKVGYFRKLGHGYYKESDVAATLRANNGDAHSSDLIMVQVVTASASDVVEEAETYTDQELDEKLDQLLALYEEYDDSEDQDEDSEG
jgi:hypothetical protein